MFEMPRIVRRSIEDILSAVDEAHFRHVGDADDNEPGILCGSEKRGCLLWYIAAKRARSPGQADAGDGSIVLDQKGRPGKGTIAYKLRCLLAGAVVGLVDNGIEFRVEAFDLADRVLDHFARCDLFAA